MATQPTMWDQVFPLVDARVQKRTLWPHPSAGRRRELDSRECLDSANPRGLSPLRGCSKHVSLCHQLFVEDVTMCASCCCGLMDNAFPLLGTP